MCKECGCGDAGHHHDHSHGDHHHHHGDGNHAHTHEQPGRRTVKIEQKLLLRNSEQAARNREWLAKHRVTAVNMISSPGSGKTMLLERTLERLRGEVPCAVITGDPQTDNDARRLQGRGAEVRQIETQNACHLDAQRVGDLLPEVTAGGVRLLFIENVGNLVCPAAFDLGENFKVALLSATEGEDKPLKYPTLFMGAPVVVLTKMDLLPHLDWDGAKCRDYLRRIHPGVFIFELSAKSGLGMDAWLAYLKSLVA